MKKIAHVFHWIDVITNWIAALSLVATFLLVFLNVLTRYIFKTGFSWSEEGARYALMALIIFGVIEVTHYREHFYVDLVVNAVPPVVKTLFQIISDVLMLVCMMILVVGSFQMTQLNWTNKTAAIGLPSWLPYGFMLLACSVSVLYLVSHLLIDLHLLPPDILHREEEE